MEWREEKKKKKKEKHKAVSPIIQFHLLEYTLGEINHLQLVHHVHKRLDRSDMDGVLGGIIVSVVGVVELHDKGMRNSLLWWYIVGIHSLTGIYIQETYLAALG